jgi:tetratricopeptide (TPR) repeat protein
MKHIRILKTLLCFVTIVFVAHGGAIAQKRVTTKELCARFIKLGLSYRETGDHDNALYFLNKGLNLARQTGSRYWEAASYEGMGLVYKDMRDKSSAIEALLAARRIYNDIIVKPNGSSREAIDRIIEQTQMMDFSSNQSDAMLASEVQGLRQRVESLKNENAALREEIAMLRGGYDIPPAGDRSSAMRRAVNPDCPDCPPTPINAAAQNQRQPLDVPMPPPSDLIDLDALENANAFTSLEAALRNPDAVIKLDLSNNGMKVLPPEIGRFRNLQYLNLSRNQLGDLPREVCNLKKLQYLNVSGNQLDQLPNEIGGLSNLKQLIVSQNFLKKLPPEIGKLGRLEYLEANENRLTQIPAALGLATSLRDLAFRTNFIAFMPAEIGKLKRLRTLDVDNNSFTDDELANLQATLPDTQIISETQQGQAQAGEQQQQQQETVEEQQQQNNP